MLATSPALARWLKHARWRERFNPNQPRDGEGKWTDGLGGSTYSFEDYAIAYPGVVDEIVLDSGMRAVVMDDGDIQLAYSDPVTNDKITVLRNMNADDAWDLGAAIHRMADEELDEDAENDPDMGLVNWEVFGDEDDEVIVGYNTDGEMHLDFGDDDQFWISVEEASEVADALQEIGDQATEATSPALARWLEHGTHNQKSHGNRYRIPGDKRSGILPSIGDLKKLAASKGVKVSSKARKADIAKMLDDAGRSDDLFPGRPRQSEKLDAKLDAAFGPAPAAPKKRAEPKAPKTKAVWQPAGELPATGTVVRQNTTSWYIQWDNGGRVERISKARGRKDGDLRLVTDEEFAGLVERGEVDEPPGDTSGSVGAAVRQAVELSDGTGRPSRVEDPVSAAFEHAMDTSRYPGLRMPWQAPADTSGRPGGRVEAAKADIRDVIASQRKPGEWMGLADLRDALGSKHSRADVDQALLSLMNEPDVSVMDAANRRALKPRDRDAALDIAGLHGFTQSTDAPNPGHAIRIDPKLAERSDRTPSKFLDTSGAKPAAEVAFAVHTGKVDDLTDSDLSNALARLPEGSGDWRAVKAERDRRAPKAVDASRFTGADKLAAARLMFGDDESKWPAHAKRDAAKLRKQAAKTDELERAEKLSTVDIMRGETLTKAGQEAINRLGPAGHPRVAAVADAEGKIRTAYAMLDRPNDPGSYVSLENLRKLIGDRAPRAEIDDVLRRMAHQDGVDVTPQSYARDNAATRIPAAVMIGGQENNMIRIQPAEVPDEPASAAPSTRPSGLPAKPASGDFDDLADRVSRMRTEAQIHEVLTDLNATELTRLAHKFAGDPTLLASSRTRDAQTGLKLIRGMSVDERRRWLAKQLIDAQSRRDAWR